MVVRVDAFTRYFFTYSLKFFRHAENTHRHPVLGHRVRDAADLEPAGVQVERRRQVEHVRVRALEQVRQRELRRGPSARAERVGARQRHLQCFLSSGREGPPAAGDLEPAGPAGGACGGGGGGGWGGGAPLNLRLRRVSGPEAHRVTPLDRQQLTHLGGMLFGQAISLENAQAITDAMEDLPR